MSAEFGQSSNERQTSYRDLPSAVLRRLAEKTEYLYIIEKILDVATNRALENEFDIEANELFVFVAERQYELEKAREVTMHALESEIAWRTKEDDTFAKNFYAVSAYYYMKDEPELATQEEARIALFKQQ